MVNISARWNSVGLLYVVATPIGNLEDVTLRALRILRECKLIAAEDTRVTRKLLSHYDIHTPLVSFNQNSRSEKLSSLIKTLLNGEDVALVSDAGTPGVSDPGMDLVRTAIEAGIRVEAIPGASAVISALVTSGISTATFAFLGFAPRTTRERFDFFDSLINEARTTVIYEAPSRLRATLKALEVSVADRPIAVCRELTKKFEEIVRGTPAEAILHFGKSPVRGEIAIVIQGCPVSTPVVACNDDDVEAKLIEYISGGMTKRSAIEAVSAELGVSKRSVYAVANSSSKI